MMNNLSRDPAVARWSCSSDMVACKESLTDSLRGAAVTCVLRCARVMRWLACGTTVALAVSSSSSSESEENSFSSVVVAVIVPSSSPPSFPSSASYSLPP
eukprot:scaffold56740_cov67-Attheya_sp.AAC.1